MGGDGSGLRLFYYKPLISDTFFVVFIIQYLRAGFRPLHAPSGGVAMPSLSEGNLDLKRGCFDHGFSPKPEISGL